MSRSASLRSDPPSRGLERALIALAALAAWSIAPPYAGPLVGLELDVDASLEFVDHVVPGILAAAGAMLALRFARRGEGDSTAALVAVAVCALSGLFETVTHVPLVLDAGGEQQPVGAVILHSSPGPVLLVLALVLLLRPMPPDAP